MHTSHSDISNITLINSKTEYYHTEHSSIVILLEESHWEVSTQNKLLSHVSWTKMQSELKHRYPTNSDTWHNCSGAPKIEFITTTTHAIARTWQILLTSTLLRRHHRSREGLAHLLLPLFSLFLLPNGCRPWLFFTESIYVALINSMSSSVIRTWWCCVSRSVLMEWFPGSHQPT